jgi:hypothetical protein
MWYLDDAQTPEYHQAMMKIARTQPETMALAKRILGDQVMASLETEGIKRELAGSQLAVNKTKIDTAKEKLASTVGKDYNDLISDYHALNRDKEQFKIDQAEREFYTKNTLGALGLGISGYQGYKKLQYADTMGADALSKYLNATG